tara:strand:+ start:541 stop:708 length:168 start_codon:yes stop_codon:yes gene_type:complete
MFTASTVLGMCYRQRKPQKWAFNLLAKFNKKSRLSQSVLAQNNLFDLFHSQSHGA